MMRAAYEEADLALADGMPVVWLSRLAAKAAAVGSAAAGRPERGSAAELDAQPLPERVTGADPAFQTF